MNTTKKEFVEKLGEVLRLAKPNLVKCEYSLGKDIEPRSEYNQFIDDDEFVLVYCDNGYRYTVNITGNSHSAIAYAVFDKMMSK
jgi:hypothetical protein